MDHKNESHGPVDTPMIVAVKDSIPHEMKTHNSLVDGLYFISFANKLLKDFR